MCLIEKQTKHYGYRSNAKMENDKTLRRKCRRNYSCPHLGKELLDVKPKAWSLKNSDKFAKMNPFVPEKMTLRK